LHSFAVGEWPDRARAEAALSLEIEYTFRIAGEECSFGGLPKIESVARFQARLVGLQNCCLIASNNGIQQLFYFGSISTPGKSNCDGL
jgi:hypothetical protein